MSLGSATPVDDAELQHVGDREVAAERAEQGLIADAEAEAVEQPARAGGVRHQAHVEGQARAVGGAHTVALGDAVGDAPGRADEEVIADAEVEEAPLQQGEAAEREGGSAAEQGDGLGALAVGRLDGDAQAQLYDQAQWYLSLPRSDSVSVSVLEAMAHGCVPILSDLPANRELVRDGDNGLILRDGALAQAVDMDRLLQRARTIADDNRAWVRRHALFAPAVAAFVDRLRAFPSR